MARDIMEVLADWPNIQRTERGASVRTSCIMPSGSLLHVSVQPAIDGWIVSDEGSAIYEATGSGKSVERLLRGLKSLLVKRGLMLEQGKIYSERVGVAELPYMVAYVATAALEAATWLIARLGRNRDDDISTRLPIYLSRTYPNLRMTEPLTLLGNSSRQYSFENVLLLPNKMRLILDPVSNHDGSIKSRLVANLDIRRAEHDRVVQRLVYDDDMEWKQADLALLAVGAPTVPFSMLSSVVNRLMI